MVQAIIKISAPRFARSEQSLCSSRLLSGKQPRHLYNGGVKNVEEELRRDTDHEHEKRDWNNRPLLVRLEIGKIGAGFSERTAEERLHRAHKDNGSKKETKHRDGGIAGSDGKGTFEDEKLADKAVQSWQAE